MTLSMEVTARDGLARAGVIRTARGEVHTPCFMPVGTRGAVRTLSAADLDDLGVQIVLGNTYHLMLKPGAELIAGHGGLHGFTDWDGHVLTDSGGYQIFSLEPGGNVRLDDDGVTFRSTYDGGTHRLTPESAVAIQTAAGQRLPDGARRVRPAAVAAQPCCDRRWTAPPSGPGEPARPSSPSERPDLSQIGHRAGRHRRRPAGRERGAHRATSGFDGYAVGGSVGGGVRATPCSTRWPPPCRPARGPAALPDGAR